MSDNRTSEQEAVAVLYKHREACYMTDEAQPPSDPVNVGPEWSEEHEDIWREAMHKAFWKRVAPVPDEQRPSNPLSVYLGEIENWVDRWLEEAGWQKHTPAARAFAEIDKILARWRAADVAGEKS